MIEISHLQNFVSFTYHSPLIWAQAYHTIWPRENNWPFCKKKILLLRQVILHGKCKKKWPKDVHTQLHPKSCSVFLHPWASPCILSQTQCLVWSIQTSPDGTGHTFVRQLSNFGANTKVNGCTSLTLIQMIIQDNLTLLFNFHKIG